ncbi:MAG: uncharacterized protein QOK42_701 [Frankiaceae bacterium]|jgi:membrane protein YdbS with pleckstrin-like domain|nr:uncharacterized protein [Frankiaceae bacterium]
MAGAVIVPVGLLLAAAAGADSGPVAVFAVLALTAVGLGTVWLWQQRRWSAWGWAEREDDLLVRRGVLVRRVSVVPYGRMQFVDVIAGPLDRRIGVAAVHLHTASAAADVHVPGIEREAAERLRDRLAALGEARAAGL